MKEQEEKKEDEKESFLDRHPNLKKIATFFTHPTIWRLVALAFAVGATIITGGAMIPVISLVATALTSLLGVVGKVMQNRSLEKLKFQNGLTKAIESRDKDMQQLRKRNPEVFRILEEEGKPFAKSRKLHEVKNISPESRWKSIGRVLRYIGLEKFWTVALFSAVADPVGATVYIAGIALGTYVVKSEYDYRVLEEQEKSKLKQEINERCKMLDIVEYSSEKELYKQFKDRMINSKATELLCKEDVSGKTDEQIVERFEAIRGNVEQKMQFVNIPKEISLVRNVVDAINPLKKENEVRAFDVEFDATKSLYKMDLRHEGITESKKQHLEVSIGALEGVQDVKERILEARESQIGNPRRTPPSRKSPRSNAI